jgi:hypothetical protein
MTVPSEAFSPVAVVPSEMDERDAHSHRGAHTGPAEPLLCLNCESALGGQYCARCGQKVAHATPSMHDMVHEATHELVHLDGKVWRTLWLLVSRPGFLTAELLRGRRVRYIQPLRLYLTCSIFALLVVGATRPARVESTQPSRDASMSSALADSIFRHQRDDKGRPTFIARLRTRAELGSRPASDGGRPVIAAGQFISFFKFLSHALIPISAVVMCAAYRRRRITYATALYFSTHLFAGLMLIVATVFVVGFLARAMHLPSVSEALLQLMLALASLVYCVRSLRLVFGSPFSATALITVAVAASWVAGFVVYAVLWAGLTPIV